MRFCAYCGHGFTRDEHLERHILTHTNVKPYRCFSCHMSFARRDLLHRHYTVHGRDGNQDPLPPDGIIPKSAGRTPIACSNCAKTKTKCDKKFPCSRCAARNLECTVRPTRRTTKGMAKPAGPEDAPSTTAIQPSSSSSESLESSSDASTRSSACSTPPPDTKLPEAAAKTATGGETLHITVPKLEDRPLVQSPAAATPAETPGAHMMQMTPSSAYGDFFGGIAGIAPNDSDPLASPDYFMDWSQMQVPMNCHDPSTSSGDVLMSPPMHFMPQPMSPADNIVPIFAGHFNPGPQNLHTPISSDSFDQHFSNGTMDPSDSSLPLRRDSSMSTHTATDAEAVVAGQDSWTAYRCNAYVPHSECPKTARFNLEKLEESLKNHEAWSNWRPSFDEADFPLAERIDVATLDGVPRDKLLAITQMFLHKALEIHQDEPSLSEAGSTLDHSSNFVILPPAHVLGFLLEAYANSFERFYPLTSRGVLNPNALMHGHNDKASSLLLLLMIAQGALITPCIDGRWLTGGLTEACRISLFDLIEKNIMLSGDPMVLHSALLFTVQAGWSGDKWQMDIALGQRGMYVSMLRHSGFLEPPRAPPTNLSQGIDIDVLWNDWIYEESRSRLVYAWVMVDQDLSLFQDAPPMFSVTEFGAPMPDTDALWRAKSAGEWSHIFEQVHEFSGGYSSLGSGIRPMCLRDLFRHFLKNDCQGIELTPLHLRLLLHPLQGLVCQFRQLLSCFSEASGLRQNSGSRTVTAASTRTRLEEVQTMIQRWYGLADCYLKKNPMCPMMQANLVMFHLISLNTVINFPEIERVARREGVDGTYHQLTWLHKQCISDVEEALFHGGQIIRLIRKMPRSVRPPWWAAAMYRVAMLMWCDSLVHSQTLSPASGKFRQGDMSFAIDNLPPDHASIVRYLTKREGTPTLTRHDGTCMALDNPFAVLYHCVSIIGEGVSTRFSDGICNKLTRLARSW